MAPDLIVDRQRRLGRERLVVRTVHGQRVGWFDPASGEQSIDLPEYSAAFAAALARHQAGRDAEGSAPADGG